MRSWWQKIYWSVNYSTFSLLFFSPEATFTFFVPFLLSSLCPYNSWMSSVCVSALSAGSKDSHLVATQPDWNGPEAERERERELDHNRSVLTSHFVMLLSQDQIIACCLDNRTWWFEYIYEKSRKLQCFLGSAFPIITFENIHFFCSTGLLLPVSVCEFAGGLALKCADPGQRVRRWSGKLPGLCVQHWKYLSPSPDANMIIWILKIQMDSWDSVSWSAYLHHPPGFSFQEKCSFPGPTHKIPQ